MSATVIEDKTSDKFTFSAHLVLHVHNLNHVQIDWSLGVLIVALSWSGNGLNCINQNIAHWVGQFWMNFRVERGLGDVDEKISADLFLNLEGFQEIEGFCLGDVHTFDDDSWVDTVGDVSLSLSHDFTDEEDVGCGTISYDIILSGGSSTNHCGSRMLNLHFSEQDSSIFGKFDLSSTSDKHLDGSLWSKICLENLLQAFCGIDVDAQSLGLPDNISIRIYQLK